MADNLSFKEKVRGVAIGDSKKFMELFVENDYLIFSKDFDEKPYYILSANKDNYLHLIGVHSYLSANDFFEKCIIEQLNVDDFDFKKQNQSEKEVKGSVRRKIKCLIELKDLFDKELFVQENFKKNYVKCALATSDKRLTLGFTNEDRMKPKTLLKGNLLTQSALKVDLVISKKRCETKFSHIVIGNLETIENNIELFEDIISQVILDQLLCLTVK